ncbi:hypothetical protein BJ875DRAFT_485081 [Amylocarpus encephaloides]|uniref:Rhodopsin domain-containing protein n=1 Tax=Amylocarpus encephaloides TaxID=45428 RepID=A0A9P8C4T9_9HELO|nr:hypothetical protein BJ875DRAFT_485081 [Amylocarpus encephaloides]
MSTEEAPPPIVFAPQPWDGPNNHGPLINVMTWFLVIVSFLTVSTRIATKWLVSKKANVDDAMISTSLLFSIGQVVAIGISVVNGVGKHIDGLSSYQVAVFQKAIYSANILWLASQMFSKLSVIMFIRVISPATFNAQATLGLILTTAVWGLTSIVSLVFQCHVPQVWNTIDNKCIDRDTFWAYTNSVNIIIDVVLIALPWAVVWNLQLSMQRKVVVVGCFATRAFTIGAVIFQMVVLNSTKNSPDASYDQWLVQIAMALAQTLAIVTACVPYLKPFMDGLESGMIRSDDLLRRTEAPGTKGGAYAYGQERKSPTMGSTIGKSVKRSTSRLSKISAPMRPTPHEMGPIKNATINTISVGRNPHDDHEWEASSDSSQTKIIKQTRSWGVVSSDATEVAGSETGSR